MDDENENDLIGQVPEIIVEKRKNSASLEKLKRSSRSVCVWKSWRNSKSEGRMRKKNTNKKNYVEMSISILRRIGILISLFSQSIYLWLSFSFSIWNYLIFNIIDKSKLNNNNKKTRFRDRKIK